MIKKIFITIFLYIPIFHSKYLNFQYFVKIKKRKNRKQSYSKKTLFYSKICFFRSKLLFKFCRIIEASFWQNIIKNNN